MQMSSGLSKSQLIALVATQREIIKKNESIGDAARGMLAALKDADDYVQSFRDGAADICLTKVRAAIAMAEAAGIK